MKGTWCCQLGESSWSVGTKIETFELGDIAFVAKQTERSILGRLQFLRLVELKRGIVLWVRGDELRQAAARPLLIAFRELVAPVLPEGQKFALASAVFSGAPEMTHRIVDDGPWHGHRCRITGPVPNNTAHRYVATEAGVELEIHNVFLLPLEPRLLQ